MKGLILSSQTLQNKPLDSFGWSEGLNENTKSLNYRGYSHSSGQPPQLEGQHEKPRRDTWQRSVPGASWGHCTWPVSLSFPLPTCHQASFNIKTLTKWVSQDKGAVHFDAHSNTKLLGFVFKWHCFITEIQVLFLYMGERRIRKWCRRGKKKHTANIKCISNYPKKEGTLLRRAFQRRD